MSDEKYADIEATEIINLKDAQNKYAFNALQCRLYNNTILVHYPKIDQEKCQNFQDQQGNAFVKVTMIMQSGFITSGFKETETQFVGKCIDMLYDARCVKGVTYPIKEVLKQYGFH
ncbi:MAG: hypothetical protein WC934_02925, partial [Acidithiobacillus sp.]|uniref:hypothetical protein n=1 Tax=Acidithiobacillus sp. TaxID=1872118 RepID=UPI00355D41A2